MAAYDPSDTASIPPRERPGAGARRPLSALRVLGSGLVFELSPAQTTFTVGSGSSCDVMLADPYVSGQHCTLERRGSDRLIVRDLGSKNGSFVAGNRVEVAELRVGSVLTVGRSAIVAATAGRAERGGALAALVGESAAFQDALALARRAATTECNVLVVGETGTGKELVARAIHELSRRCSEPFVPVNCGAIPRELIGSELFGHERGAFTGAVSARDGVFVQASGGTLFLDEIGELPRDQQPHLLRVLETRRVRRLGASGERAVNVRLVAATNQLGDLGGDASPLRADLYHRVATVVIALPPLRERTDDIPRLVRVFVAEQAQRVGPRRITPTTMEGLCAYPWPGNVRELRHAVERAVMLCDDELTLEALLPEPPRAETSTGRAWPGGGARPDTAAGQTGLRLGRGAAESAGQSNRSYEAAMRALIEGAYDQYGSMRRAARALGMPKSTFADRVRRYGLRRPVGRGR